MSAGDSRSLDVQESRTGPQYSSRILAEKSSLPLAKTLQNPSLELLDAKHLCSLVLELLN